MLKYDHYNLNKKFKKYTINVKVNFNFFKNLYIYIFNKFKKKLNINVIS